MESAKWAARLHRQARRRTLIQKPRHQSLRILLDGNLDKTPLRRRRRYRERPAKLLSRSEEHTSELQSHHDLVCRLLLEKKKSNALHPQHSITNLIAGSGKHHPPTSSSRLIYPDTLTSLHSV